MLLAEINFQACSSSSRPQARPPRKARPGERRHALSAVRRAAAGDEITVLGAGAWGTALAAIWPAAAHTVACGPATRAQGAAFARRAKRQRYLPGVRCLPRLRSQRDLSAALDARGRQLRDRGHADGRAAQRCARVREPARAARVCWLCKGFEADAQLPGRTRCARPSPPRRIARRAVWTRASRMKSARAGRRRCVAARPRRARRAPVAAFHHDAMRIYTSDDIVGVEVGGAVKNVLAIATGIADGLGLGLNARAALITRGLAEMTRLGVALGARAETFRGLSGLGDLVLTATGDLSRNRTVGLLLARAARSTQILRGARSRGRRRALRARGARARAARRSRCRSRKRSARVLFEDVRRATRSRPCSARRQGGISIVFSCLAPLAPNGSPAAGHVS